MQLVDPINAKYHWGRAGVGTGCFYGSCVGNALKWFPERRGLAAGITAMGFGVGSAFTVSPGRSIFRGDDAQHHRRPDGAVRAQANAGAAFRQQPH